MDVLSWIPFSYFEEDTFWLMVSTQYGNTFKVVSKENFEEDFMLFEDTILATFISAIEAAFLFFLLFVNTDNSFDTFNIITIIS
jgi:hypothetical protein